MICTCQSCHAPFWRYRRDWPPPGFCSYPCMEVGPKKLAAPAPRLPEDVLALMRKHRLDEHAIYSAATREWTYSMLSVHNCDRCEELEAEYAEAITYHVSRITSEILSESEKLRLSGRSTNA
jgi:hypothetical protein